ncbi:MAG TPA: DNA replication and repair protein RecF, partial [Chitinophagales bacterium]
MFLQKINLTNFKNHAARTFAFSQQFSAFVGANGSGKTNMLDLIYFLSMTKSYFNLTDQQLIKWNADFLRIEAIFQNSEQQHNLIVKLPQGKRKNISLNEMDYVKASDHIGQIPVMIISPEDSNIIQGASEERRKLFDSVISQVDKQYLEALIQYTKVLEQRNSLLKLKAERPSTDISTIEFYNHQLAQHGSYIFAKRKDVFERFEKIFERYYDEICGKNETVKWQYVSQLLESDWQTLFQQHHQKDLILQRTNVGIHKDDFEFSIHGEKIKKFGSQGQQKSFSIALKLSLYQYLHEMKGQAPILLIDDVFDKLDKNRMK